MLVDLLGPIKAAFRTIIEAAVDGMEAMMEVILSLYVGLLRSFIDLNPSELEGLQRLWEVSLTIYFASLGVASLSFLAMLELFPGKLQTDPYRYGERVLKITVVIFLVNPPGEPSGLFSRGVFAWAFAFTNAVQDMYLADATSLSLTLDVGSLLQATGTMYAMLVAMAIMTVLLVLSVLPAVVVLAVRQLVLYGIYGLFPLLGLLWVVDVGPLKYGNTAATMAFKAAPVLMAMGILISGGLAVSTSIVESSASGGHASTVETGGPTVEVVEHEETDRIARGVLASSGGNPLSVVTTIVNVVASALLVGVVGLLAAIVVANSALGGTGGSGGGSDGQTNQQSATAGESRTTASERDASHVGESSAASGQPDDAAGGTLSGGASLSPVGMDVAGARQPIRRADGGDDIVNPAPVAGFGDVPTPDDDFIIPDGDRTATHDMGDVDAIESDGTIYDGTKAGDHHAVSFSAYVPADGEEYMLENSELDQVVAAADRVEEPGDLYEAADRAARRTDRDVHNATIPGLGESLNDVKGRMSEGELLERDYQRRGLEPIAGTGMDSVVNLEFSDRGVDGIAKDPDTGDVHVHVTEGKMSTRSGKIDGSQLTENEVAGDQMTDEWIMDTADDLANKRRALREAGRITPDEFDELGDVIGKLKDADIQKEIHVVQDCQVSPATINAQKLEQKRIDHVSVHKTGNVINQRERKNGQ